MPLNIVLGNDQYLLEDSQCLSLNTKSLNLPYFYSKISILNNFLGINFLTTKERIDTSIFLFIKHIFSFSGYKENITSTIEDHIIWLETKGSFGKQLKAIKAIEILFPAQQNNPFEKQKDITDKIINFLPNLDVCFLYTNHLAKLENYNYVSNFLNNFSNDYIESEKDSLSYILSQQDTPVYLKRMFCIISVRGSNKNSIKRLSEQKKNLVISLFSSLIQFNIQTEELNKIDLEKLILPLYV